MRDGWGSSESNQLPGSGKNACLRVGGTQVDADNHNKHILLRRYPAEHNYFQLLISEQARIEIKLIKLGAKFRITMWISSKKQGIPNRETT